MDQVKQPIVSPSFTQPLKAKAWNDRSGGIIHAGSCSLSLLLPSPAMQRYYYDSLALALAVPHGSVLGVLRRFKLAGRGVRM